MLCQRYNSQYIFSIDWNYTLIYPLLIIGGLLVVTFSKSELLKEITQWYEKQKGGPRIREGIGRRNADFLKCWKKGMSNEKLAKKFDLKIQRVEELKENIEKELNRGTPTHPPR